MTAEIEGGTLDEVFDFTQGALSQAETEESDE
jgi:hypothetical protein